MTSKTLPCFTCGELGHWAMDCPRKAIIQEAKRIRAETLKTAPLPLDRSCDTYLKQACLDLLTPVSDSVHWYLDNKLITSRTIRGGMISIKLEDGTQHEWNVHYIPPVRRCTVMTNVDTIYLMVNCLTVLNQPINKDRIVVTGTGLLTGMEIVYVLTTTQEVN